MSTMEEMVRDLKRAIELEDIPAAIGIAVEMQKEAESLGFEELGQELFMAVQQRSLISAMIIARQLGEIGGQHDQARGLVFGDYFMAGRETIRLATSPANLN